MIDLNGKTVLVTGASRGIGAAIARAVARAGGRVIAHYGRSEAAAKALQDEIGAAACLPIQADLADPVAVAGLWPEACALASPIDVLVNNAGVFEPAPLDGTADEWRAAWSRVMQINLLAGLFRQALVVKEEGLGNPNQISSAFQKRGIRMWPARARQILGMARQFSLAELERALVKLFQADRDLRRERPDDRIIVEQLVVQLTI